MNAKGKATAGAGFGDTGEMPERHKADPSLMDCSARKLQLKKPAQANAPRINIISIVLMVDNVCQNVGAAVDPPGRNAWHRVCPECM